jgi:hypothetical protein
MQKLHDAGAVSRAELEQGETAFKNAEAQLAAVQSLIRQNQVELQYYRVTAPSAGVVGEIPIRQGDRVTPATLITTIDQPEGLEAYISLPLERAGQLRPGLLVELLDSEGKVIASNPVTFIAPRADDATQSVLVKATLRQMPPSIRVMQYVRARIVWSNDPGRADRRGEPHRRPALCVRGRTGTAGIRGAAEARHGGRGDRRGLRGPRRPEIGRAHHRLERAETRGRHSRKAIVTTQSREPSA